MGILEKTKLFTNGLKASFGGARMTLNNAMTLGTGYSIYIPEHILIAPQDLRTCDPTMPQQMTEGSYTFGQRTVETKGGSPFDAMNPAPLWEKELHEFAWIRHFSTSDDRQHKVHFQRLINEWIRKFLDNRSHVSWKIDTVSRRLINWLSHSSLLLSNVDHEFHERFMQALGEHARYLHRSSSVINNEYDRLLAYIALNYASLCFKLQTSSLDAYQTKLGQELVQQINANGVHVSRNPARVVETLSLLLPLQGCFASAKVQSHAELDPAIFRLLSALQFFRNRDGALARFNGSGTSETDLITTLMRYAKSGHPVPFDASLSGYQRLEISETKVLMDVGEPPKNDVSPTTHAGCLSFELSCDSESIVINCGAGQLVDDYTKADWRISKAHSTAVMNGTSSSKFENIGRIGHLLRGPIVADKLRAKSEREDDESSQTVTASHFGYVREFGARHERKLTLAENGNVLTGADWFSGPDKGDLRYSTKDAVVLHFHLHPVVKATMVEGECLLQTRRGQQWRFTAPDFSIAIEDSFYYASLTGSQKIQQIIIKANVSKRPEIKWTFEKLK